MTRPVSAIPNLGPASQEAFARAGIHSAEEIEALGPDAAYERLVRKFHPERHREPERKKAAEKLLVRLETARDGLKAYARRRS